MDADESIVYKKIQEAKNEGGLSSALQYPSD